MAGIYDSFGITSRLKDAPFTFSGKSFGVIYLRFRLRLRLPNFLYYGIREIFESVHMDVCIYLAFGPFIIHTGKSSKGEDVPLDDRGNFCSSACVLVYSSVLIINLSFYPSILHRGREELNGSRIVRVGVRGRQRAPECLKRALENHPELVTICRALTRMSACGLLGCGGEFLYICPFSGFLTLSLSYSTLRGKTDKVEEAVNREPNVTRS